MAWVFNDNVMVSLSLGCEQMVMELTHIDGGVLDLVLTDVCDFGGVRVGLPIGTFNHGLVL